MEKGQGHWNEPEGMAGQYFDGAAATGSLTKLVIAWKEVWDWKSASHQMLAKSSTRIAIAE